MPALQVHAFRDAAMIILELMHVTWFNSVWILKRNPLLKCNLSNQLEFRVQSCSESSKLKSNPILIQSGKKMSQSQSHNSIQSEASGSTKEPGADIPRSLHTGRCWTTGWSTSILTGSALSLYGPDPWIGGLGVKSEVWRFWSLVPSSYCLFESHQASGLVPAASGTRSFETALASTVPSLQPCSWQAVIEMWAWSFSRTAAVASCQLHWYTHTHTPNEKKLWKQLDTWLDCVIDSPSQDVITCYYKWQCQENRITELNGWYVRILSPVCCVCLCCVAITW